MPPYAENNAAFCRLLCAAKALALRVPTGHTSHFRMVSSLPPAGKILRLMHACSRSRNLHFLAAWPGGRHCAISAPCAENDERPGGRLRAFPIRGPYSGTASLSPAPVTAALPNGALRRDPAALVVSCDALGVRIFQAARAPILTPLAWCSDISFILSLFATNQGGCATIIFAVALFGTNWHGLALPTPPIQSETCALTEPPSRTTGIPRRSAQRIAVRRLTWKCRAICFQPDSQRTSVILSPS